MTTPTDAGLQTIDAATLHAWLQDGDELALIDVREEGVYGEAHALLAVNIPYSRLERDIARLTPRRATRIVLIGNDDAHAALAARRLGAIGYTSITVLQGGSQAWQAAGHRLFPSVNTPSKAFAEFVEHAYHTPDIEAAELDRLYKSGAALAILDSRTVEEYERFHVPGAISCPGSELVYRFADLVPSPDTLVVISCAGRTRGVMGAQTLLNAGVPNRVLALSGGTQGWRLAHLPMASGREKIFSDVSSAAQGVARQRADQVGKRFDVPHIDHATLQGWQDDGEHTVYLFDIRTAQEYAAGHVEGARHVQGVQLIQCIDQHAATRNARVVLSDNDGVRATVVAHWLLQLGWQASVLDQARNITTITPAVKLPAGIAAVESIDVAEAQRRIAAGAVVLSIDSSADYRRAHVQGAVWVNRSGIEKISALLKSKTAAIIFARDAALAQLFALDLKELLEEVAVVQGGTDAWRAAGLPVAASPDLPADADRVDYLFWLHDRHDGNLASSAAYLQWEADLPALVGAQQNAGFRLPRQS